MAAQPEALDHLVVVLWEPQNYVNVAGVVRAMKNFGLSRLRLVSPVDWDPRRIEGIAHDTGDIIAATRIVDSLAAALGDCSFVAGLTARERRAKRAVERPRTLAPALLERALDARRTGAGPVALLFGREDKGLSNEALDFCHRTVTIPTNPTHASLNLAQAVLLTVYELWMAAAGELQEFREPRRAAPPASVEQLEHLFADAERALWAIEFFKSRQTEAVMRTLRELVRRTDLDTREAAFARAMAIEVVKYLRRMGLQKGEPPPDSGGAEAGPGDGPTPGDGLAPGDAPGPGDGPTPGDG